MSSKKKKGSKRTVFASSGAQQRQLREVKKLEHYCGQAYGGDRYNPIRYVAPAKVESAPARRNHDILGIKKIRPVLKDGKCHCVKDIKPLLYMPPKIWTELQYLMQKYPTLEWSVVGDVVDGVITGYRIPKQKNSKAETEILEPVTGNLHVHSHNSMGASWSSTDHEHLLCNWEWCIVMSTTGYKVAKKMELPCGGSYHVEGDLKLLVAPEDKTSIDLVLAEKVTNTVTVYKSTEEFTKATHEALPGTTKSPVELVRKRSTVLMNDTERLEERQSRLQEDALDMLLRCLDCHQYNCYSCSTATEFADETKMDGNLPFCFVTACDLNCVACHKRKAFETSYRAFGNVDLGIEDLLQYLDERAVNEYIEKANS